MSVFYKVVRRSTGPCIPNATKKCYPHLITLGQCVNLVHLAQKKKVPSSLSVCDIKSLIHDFMDEMKGQLQERTPVNIEGLGISRLSMCPEGIELKKNIMVKREESLHVFLMANKELHISPEEQKLELSAMNDLPMF